MDGFITIGTKLDTKQFDKQIEQLEKDLSQMERAYETGIQIANPQDKQDLEELSVKIEKTRNQLVRLRAEKQKLEQPQGLKELKTGIDNFGQGLQNAVKKASKLVLGIFGIRSAFMMMRRASSELAGYDDEYAANLEYIRFVLTQAIAPVLKGIVELAMKLLAYINAIAQAWFGVNLFERGSVDNFKKMKQGVGGVTDSVKELKKQLAGFDEINVLQEDGSVGTGGGGGGISLPMMDLANIENIQLPEWVRWIMEHKGEILGLLTAIGAFFVGTKIAAFVRSMTGAEGAVLGFNTQLGKIVAGAALAVGGLAILGNNARSLVHDWENLTEEEQATTVATELLGIGMETVGLMMMGVSGPVAAAIALVSALASVIIEEEKERIRIDDVTQAQERLTKARENEAEALKQYTNAVDRAAQTAETLRIAEEQTGISGEELNRQVERGVMDYADMTDKQKEVYRAYLDNIEAQQKLSATAKEAAQSIRDKKDAIYLDKLATDTSAEAMQKWKNDVVNAAETGEIKWEDASRIISKSMGDMSIEAQESFAQDLPDAIREGLNPSQYQTSLQIIGSDMQTFFAKLVNNILSTFLGLPFAIANIFSNLSPYRTANFSTSGQAKGAVVYHDLPKLAVGGIINQPGRGIPIGRAIAGERGAEGVIPLTDTQQMEILGETIGRYITINANIPVSMNGRVISRELRQVQAEQDFAYNM